MTTWTLEGELQKLAERPDTLEALRTLGLIGPTEAFHSLETVEEWHRSGEETYSLLFAVWLPSGRRTFLMKACVAYNGQQTLTEIFADWLERRSLLNDLGVGTPTLYGAKAATLVEEYVPYLLSDAVAAGAQREVVLRSIGETAARLVNAGFVPIRATDWRSRGADVVLVDFGQDLGPPGMSGGGSEAGLLSEVLDNLAQAGVELSPGELRLVGSCYEELLEG